MQKLEQKFIAPLVRETLSAIFGKAFGIKTDVLLQPGPKNEFEYVSPSAMKAFNLNLNKKEGTSFGCKTVAEFAQKVAQNYFENDYIGSIQANEKGFLQIRVKDSFVEERVNSLVQDLTYP
jgi:arginyl-tRNA synthetase